MLRYNGFDVHLSLWVNWPVGLHLFNHLNLFLSFTELALLMVMLMRSLGVHNRVMLHMSQFLSILPEMLRSRRGSVMLRPMIPPEMTPSRLGESDVSPIDIAAAQAADPCFGKVAQLRASQTDAPSFEDIRVDAPEAKQLFALWDQLETINGVLYRRWTPKSVGHECLQLLVPKSLRETYISQAHIGSTGGHFGVRRTQHQIQRRAFWPGWRKDIERFVRCCARCVTYHRGQLPHHGPLQPILSGAPFEKLHYDITGPHPRTRRGSHYILTCIDPFTKWAEAFPIANKEANTIARVLVEQIMCRYGTPIAGISDRGRDVDGVVMHEVCKLLHIDKWSTTPYHPSSNGAIERFHRTLNSLIGRTIGASHDDWDLLLPFVMQAYRASVHESTGMTPNYLLLGRELRAPVDLIYGTPPEKPPPSYDTYASALQDRMTQAYTIVREHLGKAALRAKRYYDLRVRHRKFHKGDWVYYFYPKCNPGQQRKWLSSYIGPYLVTAEVGPVNVMLQKDATSKPFVLM